MKTDKSLKYCVKGLCVKRYYIKEMPRNSKVEIQYREFVLGQVVGFCGFINSALQPEQSLFSLPEYTANYKLPFHLYYLANIFENEQLGCTVFLTRKI